ncbi:MAG: hypothetical protein K0R65_1543 [Crocinitomicaceae bacterium]|jgi:hypothetical protein|nr:hypothetical protein [Crocinitomicaceae bacterium]
MALPLIALLTACPGKKDPQSFMENNYDFSGFRKFYHKGLTVQLPAYFIQEYSKTHMHKQDGLSLFDPETSIYFSIEAYTEDEATDIQFAFEEGTTPLEALNTHYADLRANSLDNPKISITQDIPKKSQLKGFYQVIKGSRNSYDYVKMVYLFATVEKKVKGEKKYFVVNLIAQEDFSKYLVDDFRRLLLALK